MKNRRFQAAGFEHERPATMLSNEKGVNVAWLVQRQAGPPEKTLMVVDGAPRLLGNLLACGLLDELFLLSRLKGRAGRGRHPRPALVANAEFTPATARG